MLDQTFANAANAGVDILLVMLNDQNPWLYSRIKFYGDIKYGMHTICCRGAKFMNEKGQGEFSFPSVFDFLLFEFELTAMSHVQACFGATLL